MAPRKQQGLPLGRLQLSITTLEPRPKGFGQLSFCCRLKKKALVLENLKHCGKFNSRQKILHQKAQD
jgi:hypothetical protein